MYNHSIDELLTDFKINFRKKGEHHHTTEGWVNIDCPYCSPESFRFRLGINETTWITNCYVCGIQNLAKVLATTKKMNLGKVIELLKSQHRKIPKTGEIKHRGILKLPSGIKPLQTPHIRYLRWKRKLSPSRLVDTWGLKGIGISNRLSWRIWIPVHEGNQIVSWTTRSISDTVDTRYVSASANEEAVPLKHLLYGEQYCHRAIIINEGPIDAWTIGPGAVATCGLGFTKQQLLRMTRYYIRVVVFDSSPDAQRRARKLSDELSVFDGKTYNVELSGKDANSTPREEIEELRRTFIY